MLRIAPCPFCGKEDLGVVDTERKKNIQNRKAGKISVVICYSCGASGPYSNDAIAVGDPSSKDREIERNNAAMVAWGARSEIERKAIEMANKIMAAALEVSRKTTNEDCDDCNGQTEMLKNAIELELESDMEKSTKTITNILSNELKKTQEQAYELGVFRDNKNLLDEKLEATSDSIERIVGFGLKQTKEQAYKLGARQAHQALSAIIKTKTSVSALRLFIAILINTLCQGTMSCNFSREQLEEISGITSSSTLYKAMDELERRKMIERADDTDWRGRWKINIKTSLT